MAEEKAKRPFVTPVENGEVSSEPLRKAIRDAISTIDSPAKADATARQLEEKAAGQSSSEAAQNAAPVGTVDEATQRLTLAGQAVPAPERAAEVLTETARLIVGSEGSKADTIANAAQEVLNPELSGMPTAEGTKQRGYLRKALLKRLKPFDALDAFLFLKINHLPHTAFLNHFFYFVTRIFTGGAVWLALLQLVKVRNRPLAQRALRETTLPLVLATFLVEVPLKRFFRRHRPFIADIKAISVGIKPSSWSFPSGHAAAAFAGAWLLRRFFPKQRGLLYAFASLGVFSRVYLGDHYPGDVISGSLFGIAFAKIISRLLRRWLKAPTEH